MYQQSKAILASAGFCEKSGGKGNQAVIPAAADGKREVLKQTVFSIAAEAIFWHTDRYTLPATVSRQPGDSSKSLSR